MLQINTGKLFRLGVEYRNTLTGVIYSNAILPSGRDVDTKAGSIRSSDQAHLDKAIIYKIEEKIESQKSGKGVLVSHSVKPYLDDFSVVACIGLEAIFSSNVNVLHALTGRLPHFSSYQLPSKYISRVFEAEIRVSEKELEDFEHFISDLLALERKSFLAAMRAMRTYVAGLHRLADDLGIAYTLMVSAVEALAQEFDGFDPSWDDIPYRKRESIDEALEGVDPMYASRIREAIVSNEHVSIGKRYREFVMSHIDDSYFKRTLERGGAPIAHYELEPALKQAYELRSLYLHQLKQLPDAIRMPPALNEVLAINRRPTLTFQGLHRLSLHVIKRFVACGKKLEKEPYDYSLERSGIVIMPLAPQYWVWHPLKNPEDARKRLEAQLSLTASVMNGSMKELTDIRSMLSDIEDIMPRSKEDYKPALACLYVLYNGLVSLECRSVDYEKFLEKYSKYVLDPSPESLLIGTILRSSDLDDWSVEAHQEMLNSYFEQRLTPKGIHAPRLFEAALCLTLAEKYRKLNLIEPARSMISKASLCHPAHHKLNSFCDNFSDDSIIDWQEILLNDSGKC